MSFSEGSHSGLSVVDTFGTHSVDMQYKPCEPHTQELIWCNFKLLQSVWGHHLNQGLSENHAEPFVFGVPNGFQKLQVVTL